MFDRVKLRRDLTDCGGRLIARAGAVLSVAGITETARAARPGGMTPIADTFVADDLAEVLRDPAYEHLLRAPQAEAGVRRVVESATLTQPLLEEVAAMRAMQPVQYRHAIATAVVTARMLQAVTGSARTAPQVAAASLLHDLGMRHVPSRVVEWVGSIHGEDATAVAEHPILGAWQLARELGDHPAVEAALGHHWRDGQGYPDLPQRPSATTGVVAVASAFAALTHPRAYRSEPFDARGAGDLLVAEAACGHADPFAVKLLVHALRGGAGRLSALRYARARPGRGPGANRHTRIGPPRFLM